MINWISGKPKERKLKARVRYGQPLVDCLIKVKDNQSAIARFAETLRAITPGQSIVFYKPFVKDTQQVLGGGIIDER